MEKRTSICLNTVNNITSTNEGRYIATRHPSHWLSHAMPHRIFGDVEEREQGEHGFKGVA